MSVTPRRLSPPRSRAIAATAVIAAALLAAGAAATQSPTGIDVLGQLRWRSIGPFAGGRTTAGSGVPGRAHHFYLGTPGGGLWKTTDTGRTWVPIFDDHPSPAIGAIAVAPSNPDVVYVGTGGGVADEVEPGDGLYTSTDAGATWTAAGLRDTETIAAIAVDPGDANRVFVAAPGRAFGADPARGVFRSADGGRTFTRVLGSGNDVGASNVLIDPAAPQTVYAVTIERRYGPSPRSVFTGSGTAIFKSTDGGMTWQPIVQGLPTFVDDGLTHVTLALAPSRPARLFAAVDAGRRGGLYRSDDGGGTWTLMSADVIPAPSFTTPPTLVVDPKNADVVFVAAGAIRRSGDGGRTFTLWTGGRDHDARLLWIDPQQPDVMLLAGARGAAVTLTGGRSWSSTWTQPTAHLPQIAIDGSFPYRVCGGLRDRGAVCVASAGASGAITARDVEPLGLPGDGRVVAHPTDAEVLFGGFVARYDRRTGQSQRIGPFSAPVPRMVSPPPLLFSPLDARTMFAGAATLWRMTTTATTTSAAGPTWTEISPELSRDSWTPPANLGVYRTRAAAPPAQRGAISAVGASFVEAATIWAGTSDGLLHLTRDAGKTWADVTPAAIPAWSAIAAIEPSHFDGSTAYIAVNAARLDDRRPLLLKTRDAGRSWTAIVRGLPDTAPVHVVREDAQRRGLLFAGTARGVFVSLDDGESWAPMRTNMPPAPVLDLAIRDADVIAATGGRGLWVLDDISPLRQITPDIARASVFLFRPPAAFRTRLRAGAAATGVATDDPAAANPPDGVAISYLLRDDTAAPMTLEIIETATGEVIRRFASAVRDVTPLTDAQAAATVGTPVLPPTAGMHRVVWDLRYAPPPSLDGSGPAAAAGMFVQPGAYQVRLTIGGAIMRQAVLIRMDPRVRASAADLALQFSLSRTLTMLMRRLAGEYGQVLSSLASAPADQRDKLMAAAAAVRAVYAPLPALFEALQSADVRPPAALESEVMVALKRGEEVLVGR